MPLSSRFALRFYHFDFAGRLRTWFRPFFRLYGNIDALIHKQAVFNRQQVNFNLALIRLLQDMQSNWARSLEKPFHYIRVLHTLMNYLVLELTRLKLQHQMLQNQVGAQAYDLEQLRKRERLVERMATLKEDTSVSEEEPPSRQDTK